VKAVDATTRAEMILLRDGLIARVQDIDRRKHARIREVTSSPTFDPMTHRMDPEVADLIGQQRELIQRIQTIDRMIGHPDPS
jgi:hypothetical protein